MSNNSIYILKKNASTEEFSLLEAKVFFDAIQNKYQLFEFKPTTSLEGNQYYIFISKN